MSLDDYLLGYRSDGLKTVRDHDIIYNTTSHLGTALTTGATISLAAPQLHELGDLIGSDAVSIACMLGAALTASKTTFDRATALTYSIYDASFNRRYHDMKPYINDPRKLDTINLNDTWQTGLLLDTLADAVNHADPIRLNHAYERVPDNRRPLATQTINTTIQAQPVHEQVAIVDTIGTTYLTPRSRASTATGHLWHGNDDTAITLLTDYDPHAADSVEHILPKATRQQQARIARGLTRPLKERPSLRDELKPHASQLQSIADEHHDYATARFYTALDADSITFDPRVEDYERHAIGTSIHHRHARGLAATITTN